MTRSIIFKSLSVAMVVAGVWGCSSKQIANKAGNEIYDDLYAQVGENQVTQVTYAKDKKGGLNQNPEVFEDNRAYNDGENSNEYYSESGIDARDYQRGSSSKPGYGDYTDGYRDGQNDAQYNWGNSWDNGFGSFNRYNYGGGFGNFYNPGVTIFLGSRNRWSNFYNPYSSFGYYDPYYAYSPYGFGGYNNFGYNNFGYNYFDPFYSNYGGSFGRYYSQPRYYSNNYASNNNGNVIGADRTNRNYGPRNTGRNSGNYNDQFTNTSKPRNTDPNPRKGAVVSDPSNANTNGYGSGAGYSARPRGGYSGTTTANTNNTADPGARIDSRGAGNTQSSGTYNARPRGGYVPNPNQTQTSTTETRNGRPSAASTTTDNNTYYARPSRSSGGRTYDNSSNSSNNNNNSTPSYGRGSSSGNSSSNAPSYSSGSSSSGSSSWGGGGSSSSGSSSSSSSGGGSRGSSGGSSSSSGGSSSGGSRGPR
jgi:hypothetical protein